MMQSQGYGQEGYGQEGYGQQQQGYPQPQGGGAAQGYDAGPSWRILMADGGLNMFFIKLIGLLITVLTAFILKPVALTMYWSAWCERVLIDGRQIRFTGTTGGFFGLWIKVLVLTAVTLTLYYWFAGRKAVAKYVDSNITWA